MTELYQLTATELKQKLASSEITSVQILESLFKRNDEIGSLTNGFIRQFREKALEQAKRLDKERAEGNVRGKLHGLPISVKENLNVAGYPSTLGVANNLKNIPTEDAAIIQLLENEGAIVIGQTNIPQAMLSGMECNNPVFGETSNPWRLTHGPGGSSGGEGAVIASGESIFGLGTDLGGSIRYPASFCGITGFKPTPNRWTNQGIITALKGQEVIRSQVGPIARTVEDLILLMEVADGRKQQQIDPRTAPVPFQLPTNNNLKGMKIGYYKTDGFFEASPACQRAVKITKEILEAQGAELIPFPIDNQLEAIQLYTSIVSSAGMRPLGEMLKGEKILPSTKTLWKIGSLPNIAKKASKSILPKFGEARLGSLASTMVKRPVHKFWKLVTQRNEFIKAEIKLWKELGIQALLCPATAAPAVPKGESKEFSAAFGYTGRFNLLGFPAGTVPITKVQVHETTGREVKDRIDKQAAIIEAASEGLPVSAQIVTLPWEDEKAIHIMKLIEKEVRKNTDYPRTPVTPVTQEMTTA